LIGMVRWPPFVERGARTHLCVEQGVQFRSHKPMVTKRTSHSNVHLPSLLSPALVAVLQAPLQRRQDRSRSLPRRPIVAGPGRFFGPYGVRPLVEDPEVNRWRVRAPGRSARLLSAPAYAPPRADAPTRLAARGVVAAERAAARRTQRAPEMRLDLRIAPGGGRGGRWRRSARGLGCAWQELQRADAPTRLAARGVVAAERAAARRTQPAPEMRLDLRIAPGGGRGGRWRRSARGLSCPIVQQL
jgi:hypothetical protein